MTEDLLFEFYHPSDFIVWIICFWFQPFWSLKFSTLLKLEISSFIRVEISRFERVEISKQTNAKADDSNYRSFGHKLCQFQLCKDQLCACHTEPCRAQTNSTINIEKYLDIDLGSTMSLPIILTCLLGLIMLYLIGECCFASKLTSTDEFLLGPKLEKDCQTSKGVFS